MSDKNLKDHPKQNTQIGYEEMHKNDEAQNEKEKEKLTEKENDKKEEIEDKIEKNAHIENKTNNDQIKNETEK